MTYYVFVTGGVSSSLGKGLAAASLGALLQERGKQSVGAGNAIAVQNLGENTAMLLMLGLYSVVVKLGVPVVVVGVGFGVIFALAIALLWGWQWQQLRRKAAK